MDILAVSRLTTSLSSLLRWVHVLAAGAWLGEVVVVVFVLAPILHRVGPDRRGWFLETVFPRIFRLASILSVTVLLAGAGLYLAMSNWQLNLHRLVSGRWGLAILIGGSLGVGLTLFHFFAESRLEGVARAAEEETVDQPALVRRLTVIPRFGLAILILIFGAMVFAARGF